MSGKGVFNDVSAMSDEENGLIADNSSSNICVDDKDLVYETKDGATEINGNLTRCDSVKNVELERAPECISDSVVNDSAGIPEVALKDDDISNKIERNGIAGCAVEDTRSEGEDCSGYCSSESPEGKCSDEKVFP